MAVLIESKITYLALSHNQQTYFTFDHHFINLCHSTQIGKLCNFTPFIWSTNKNPICETTHLMENKPYQCPFYLKISNNIQWTFLTIHNEWLYATFLPTKIQIHCPQTLSTYITPNNSGILKTQPECTIQCSQNVDVNGPHHRCFELILSSSFNQPMAMERGRSHELVGSMVGAVYVHVLRTLAR